MMLIQLDKHINEVGYLPHIMYKIYLKMDHRQNIRVKIIKFLKENIGVNSCALKLGIDFLIISKIQIIKEKIDKLTLLK